MGGGYFIVTVTRRESVKNSEPFGMNFRKFRSHVYEFCLFDDARLMQS